MSSASSARSPSAVWTSRISALIGLGVVFTVPWVAQRVTPTFEGPFGIVAAVGFLLLAGMLASQLLDAIGLPHLTAYILVGVVSGPHVLHLVDHEAVRALSPVNTLALALIALAGGAELRGPLLVPLRKSLSYATLVHSLFGTLAAAAIFLALSRMLPFTRGQTPVALLGIALLWGVLSTSRSPSATLGILAQLRPDGPLTRYALSFVMSSDIVVAVLMTLAVAVTRPMIDPTIGFALHDLLELGHELLGSTTLGVTIGLVLALYLRLVSGQLLLVLIALGFGLTEGLRYLHFDPLLTFLIAGFVVANLSEQGPKLLHAIEETSNVVFVVFFATAGAHLDLPLLGQLWPIALALAGSRIVISVVGHAWAARLAGDDPAVKRWGWASLISQAGLTLGLSGVVERAFPTFGPGFRALVIATVAINEMIGPILFKLAIDRTGEAGRAHASQSAHD